MQYGKYDEDDYKYSEKYAETAQYAYGKDTYKVRRCHMYQVYKVSPQVYKVSPHRMPESACTPESALHQAFSRFVLREVIVALNWESN